jgi:hypothetical protein
LPFDENSILFGLISSCQFFWIIGISFRFPATIQSWPAIWNAVEERLFPSGMGAHAAVK